MKNLAFILLSTSVLMLGVACDRVPEPTASTRANEVSPDEESQERNPSASGTEVDAQTSEVNREDPNLQDSVGTESGITSEETSSSQNVEDRFRPETDDEEDYTGDARGKKQAPSRP